MSDHEKLPKLPGQYQPVPDMERHRESLTLIKAFMEMDADDRHKVIEFAKEIAKQSRRYQ